MVDVAFALYHKSLLPPSKDVYYSYNKSVITDLTTNDNFNRIPQSGRNSDLFANEFLLSEIGAEQLITSLYSKVFEKKKHQVVLWLNISNLNNNSRRRDLVIAFKMPPRPMHSY
ncbi:hypothetical protein LOAG_12448 [Loa loa]|uniref:Uncharacterized protein n=1 Tax=Loa loa TaxID=7209 RepID=A0A1S0TLA4_LOALO|nr:hypothetical protein LOAG_12448 [Loa loa]EFO16061.1 hypothetical protein LOAG_12448 [Loa loa]